MSETELIVRTNGTVRTDRKPVPDHHKEIEHAVSHILSNIDGEVSSRQGLIGTPNRIARMYDEVLGGYKVDPVALVNGQQLIDLLIEHQILVKRVPYELIYLDLIEDQ